VLRVAALLAAPLLGLLVLLGWPEVDGRWEHHPSHFWLVLVTGMINLALGVVAADAARRRGDARLVLVGLSFMAAAGFLGLHALATPGVLLAASNAGFVVATPVGLLLASVPDPAEGLDLQHVERRPADHVVTAEATGCRFVARCPLAIERCRQEPPALLEARPHQSARCHVTAPEPWHASA